MNSCVHALLMIDKKTGGHRQTCGDHEDFCQFRQDKAGSQSLRHHLKSPESKFMSADCSADVALSDTEGAI